MLFFTGSKNNFSILIFIIGMTCLKHLYIPVHLAETECTDPHFICICEIVLLFYWIQNEATCVSNNFWAREASLTIQYAHICKTIFVIPYLSRVTFPNSDAISK